MTASNALHDPPKKRKFPRREGLSLEFAVCKVLPHDWGQQEDVMEALAP